MSGPAEKSSGPERTKTVWIRNAYARSQSRRCREPTVVGIRQLPSDEIEVTIDSDTTVGIDDCIALSRAVTGAFDRDAEDFALTVVSAGIGQPLVCERQYRKMVGREVDVVLRDGRKLTAEAKAFDGGALTLAYAEKVAVEGKKRRQSVIREETIPLDAIKTTAEHLNFR